MALEHRGSWTVREVATYLECSIPYAWRIIHGTRRLDVMRQVDPSSAAPAFRQQPRAAHCPHCDRGPAHWVTLAAAIDHLGRVTYYCPACGWTT